MKKITVFLLLFFALINGKTIYAENNLDSLRQKASQSQTALSYIAVCEHLYDTEENADLLILYADSIRLCALKQNTPNYLADSYAWKSEGYFMKGDFEQGFMLKRKAIQLYEKLPKEPDTTECLVSSYSDMGYYFNVSAGYDSARYYFQKGMQLSNNASDLSAHYRTMLTNYASSFLYEGKTDSALVYTIRAQKRSEQDKDTAMLIENLNQIGAIYRKQKKLDDCIDTFTKAIQLCEAQKNYRTAAFIYGNIAALCSEWKRPKEAIIFSKKALQYAQDIDNPSMIGICYSNLGTILCKEKKHRQEGLTILEEKAIPMLKKSGNIRLLCQTYQCLAVTNQQIGKTESALQYIQNLDQIASALQTDSERYRYYQAKATVLQANNHYREASNYFHKMTEMLGKGYKDPTDYTLYQQMAICSANLKDYSTAYHSLEKAYQLRDSAFQKENTEQISDFSVKYQTQEKELQIMEMKQKQLQQEAMILHTRIVVAIAILCLLTILFIVLYKRQRQKRFIAEIARSAEEKERQYLTLQKETELRLTRKYIDGLETERERLATELHDDVCNSLMALEMQIRTQYNEQKLPVPTTIETLAKIRNRVRTVSHELMPPVFQYTTLDEMLEDFISHLDLPGNTKVGYQSTPDTDWNSIPPEIGFEFYRTAQEAINNAIKYASAHSISVELKFENNQLSLTIGDNGKGFDIKKKTKGIGLRTIAQRIQSIKGTFELTSHMGTGTKIVAKISLA